MTARLSSRHGVGDAIARLRLDRGCALLTPYHRLIGRMLEVCRGAGGGCPNGSTGMGVGVAAVERATAGREAAGAAATRAGTCATAMKEQRARARSFLLM